MINGKEIRPCWSDLSIFISLPFIVQKEKVKKKSTVRGWFYCLVKMVLLLLQLLVIYFLMTLHIMWYADALMSQCENHNEMGKKFDKFPYLNRFVLYK